MAKSLSVEPDSPELDALEEFLGSTPEQLVAFTETPFGALLTKVNELGFDGGVIQAELASTGILDVEAWTSALGVDLTEFLALTPVEYAERYPEQGAPRVAAILNSIHLSEEQASLHSVAGGTNLSKGEKIGIAVGATVTGLYLAPRVLNHLILRSKAIEMAAGDPEFASDLEKGYDKGNYVATLTTDFMGIKHLDFSTKSIAVRLNHEWYNSLLPTAYRAVRKGINPNFGDPNKRAEEVSVFEDDLESRGSQEIEESMPDILFNNNDIDRNVRRASEEPSREANYLSDDLKDAAKAGIRPKNMEVGVSSELDNMVMIDLKSAAKSEIASFDVDGLSQNIKDEGSKLLDNEEEAISQKLDEVESSVEQNLNEDVQVAKQDLTSAVKREVSNDVSIAEDAAEAEVSELEEAVVTDAQAVEVAVEEKVEGAVNNLESV